MFVILTSSTAKFSSDLSHERNCSILFFPYVINNLIYMIFETNFKGSQLSSTLLSLSSKQSTES